MTRSNKPERRVLGDSILPGGRVVDAGGPIREACAEERTVFLSLAATEDHPTAPLIGALINEIRPGTDGQPDVATGRLASGEAFDIVLTVPPTIAFLGDLAV